MVQCFDLNVKGYKIKYSYLFLLFMYMGGLFCVPPQKKNKDNFQKCFNILAVRWVFKNTSCDVTFVWSNFFLFLGWGLIIKTVRKLKQRHQRSILELKLISFLILMQPS